MPEKPRKKPTAAKKAAPPKKAAPAKKPAASKKAVPATKNAAAPRAAAQHKDAPGPVAASPSPAGEVCPRCGTDKFGPEQRIRAEGNRTVRYTILVCERGHTFAKAVRR